MVHHYLIVTHCSAKRAGLLSGLDFRARSIFTHRASLADALADLIRSVRPGVTPVAAYDVTDAYERNDHAGMFPATDGQLLSPSLPNLLTPVSLHKAYAPSRGEIRAQVTGQSVPVARADAAAFILHNPSRVELRWFPTSKRYPPALYAATHA